jgi:PAS domain S-box-containing protein
MTFTNILIADDREPVRRGLRSLIESRPDWRVCGEAADGKAAVERAKELKPDIALLDVSMPEMSGLDAARLIQRDAPNCQILILSQSDPALMQKAAAEAGAKGFVHKSTLSQDLLPAIDALVKNGAGDARKKHKKQPKVEGSLIHAVVTNQVRARTEIEDRERASSLLAAIVDSSDDAIVSKNLDGTITSWNKSAERLFGYTPEEAIGRHISLIIPRDRRKEEENILGKIRRGERVDHFETVRERKDGTEIDLSLTISPVRDGSGRIIGASKVARDISERKLAQEALHQSQLRLAEEAAALRQSEERLRKLSESLDAEVRARTRELEERNQDVMRQSEQLRDLSWRLLRTQDEERRHIARELHDSAGQTLTVLGMGLAQLVQKAARSAPELATDAALIQETVQQLHREIRTASYLLHPPLLDESGLSSALGWYVQGLVERSELDITLDIEKEFGRLPHDMELAIFRLVQECLTNIHRHSDCKIASIRIVRDPDLLTIDIQDQGKGMSPARLAEIQSQGSGVGIRGIRERLRQFEGNLKIESGSSGTRILVTIPIPKTGESTEQNGLEPLRPVA